MFKVSRRNFKFYNFELECGFCSLRCIIVPVYTDMAWNSANVDYLTLIRNVMIPGFLDPIECTLLYY